MQNILRVIKWLEKVQKLTEKKEYSKLFKFY